MANEHAERRRAEAQAKLKVEIAQRKANKGKVISPKERREQKREADAAANLVARGWLVAR